MKYQAYEEYKDSGVEWLGKLPKHWVVQSLAIATKRIAVGLATSVTDYYRDEGVPIIRNMNIKEGYFDGTDMLYLDEKFASSQETKVVYEGDVIAVHTGSNLGLACIVPEEYDQCHTFTTLIVTTSEELLNRYLTYCINSAYGKAEVNRLKFGFGKDNLNVKEFKSFYTLIPSYKEQLAIANFLDHETAKIDTLIEKQQQLIKLLKEKRQAVISHAVTKGLNPNAPMRNSGVEWLGEVPEHWELVPLKYLCNFSGGGTPSKDNLGYWSDGDIPWVSPKDMKTFWISDTLDKLTDKAVEESSTNFIESGALLMVVRSGILQRTIPIAINTVRVTLNQDMKALKFNARMNVEYAANYILGNVDSLLLEWSKDGATVESIEQEYLSSSLVPVPPVEEQIKIVEEIKLRMDIFQKLESHAVNGISLLKERRTALISSAVTGKIDVRNWQAANKENKEARA